MPFVVGQSFFFRAYLVCFSSVFSPNFLPPGFQVVMRDLRFAGYAGSSQSPSSDAAEHFRAVITVHSDTRGFDFVAQVTLGGSRPSIPGACFRFMQRQGRGSSLEDVCTPCTIDIHLKPRERIQNVPCRPLPLHHPHGPYGASMIPPGGM